MKQHNLPFSALVSDAGVGIRMPIEDHAVEDIKRVFEVNTLGAIFLTQTFLPLIREHQGRLVFTSSIAGGQLLLASRWLLGSHCRYVRACVAGS
jgi:NAD(P)-dependent dehydrogenase (short-subunit alcohol dehydrogenase family)